MTKAARLRHAPDFTRVIHEGRVLMTNTMRFVAAPGSHHHARLGLTVARRAGNAVARNRIKRWTREAFRHAFDNIGAWDIVAAPLYRNPPRSYRDVAEAFQALAAHLGAVATGNKDIP